MTMKVGINGSGQVGRAFVRRSLWCDDIEVVAVNDITDAGTLAHLLAFDSTYGRLGAAVSHSGDELLIEGRPVRVTAHRDPAEIDWGQAGADIVIESVGLRLPPAGPGDPGGQPAVTGPAGAAATPDRGEGLP